jgi:tRNA (cytidine/uridine-2'-O-)-methyltransferase
MFQIALYEPEIPPNTGSIMRLCANTGCRLHLIHPLGFQLDNTRLKRAGMDYRDIAVVTEHQNYQDFLDSLADDARLFALTTKGSQNYTQMAFQENDIFLFGPESRGLPENVLATFAANNKLRLPMQANSRSLNLSNTVSIMVYEALRQQNFANLS